MSNTLSPEEQFYTMVSRHDHYYEMSDDGAVFKKGRDSHRRLTSAMDALGHEVAIPIWNRAIRDRFGELAEKSGLLKQEIGPSISDVSIPGGSNA
jgi:hypothetical protein